LRYKKGLPMEVENQFFFGNDIAIVQKDYEDWKKHFDDSIEYESEGFQFCLIDDRTIHQLVLYVVRYFFYRDERLYVMEVSALESFKNIEDAQARCNGVIEYYTRGKTYPAESIR